MLYQQITALVPSGPFIWELEPCDPCISGVLAQSSFILHHVFYRYLAPCVAGMYEGERLRDGERGWFPKDCTIEIVNSHVRARNLRMKYRLMAAADQPWWVLHHRDHQLPRVRPQPAHEIQTNGCCRSTLMSFAPSRSSTLTNAPATSA